MHKHHGLGLARQGVLEQLCQFGVAEGDVGRLGGQGVHHVACFRERGRKEGMVGLRGPGCRQTRASKPCTAHRSACRSAGRSLGTGRRRARRSAARSRRCISLSVGPTPAPSAPGPTPAPPAQPTQGGQGLVDVLRLHQLLALRAALPDALRPGQVDEVEAGVGACAGVQVLALHQDGQHCLEDLYGWEGRQGDAGLVRGACDDPAAAPSWRRHGRTLYCRTQPPRRRKPLSPSHSPPPPPSARHVPTPH